MRAAPPDPEARRPAWPLGSAVLSSVFALLAAACARESTPPRPSVPLAESGLGAGELRSDSLDLAFLAGEGRLRADDGIRLSGQGSSRLAWTRSGAARLRLPFHSTGDKVLTLRARSHESLGPRLPLSLSLNERPLGSVVLTPKEEEFRVVIPSSAQSPGENVLALMAGPDPRRRGPQVGISALEVRPARWEGRPSTPAVEGERLALPPGSSVGHYLRVPAGARLALEAEGGSGSPRLAISAEDDVGRKPLFEWKPERRGPARLEVPLDAWQGRVARLEIANAGAGGLAWVVRPRVLVLGVERPVPELPALAARAHVLLYLVDTLRADHLGAYGHEAPTSPRFDAFAREAVLFEDAWAQASWTRPAVASIFTGLPVAVHGADREDRALSPEAETLAEILKRHGYRTGAFVANRLVGARYGFDQGFDTWNGGDERLYGAGADALGERALAWLDAGSGPFFLYIHTLEPHSPYTPPAEDASLFAGEAYRGERDTMALLRRRPIPPDAFRFLLAQYKGEIRQNDRAFGALLHGLSSRGLLDASVVVFTADHGEEFLDHGGTQHAHTLYQELVRVPLAWRLPGGLRAGTRVTRPVQQIDLLPTLLHVVGVERPQGLPGRDLVPQLLGASQHESLPPLMFAEERFLKTDKVAARAGPLKLIVNNDAQRHRRTRSPLELYDLERDPAERENLAETSPIALAYMQRELERFRAATAAVARAGPRRALTPEELERLRALGYLQ